MNALKPTVFAKNSLGVLNLKRGSLVSLQSTKFITQIDQNTKISNHKKTRNSSIINM